MGPSASIPEELVSSWKELDARIDVWAGDIKDEVLKKSFGKMRAVSRFLDSISFEGVPSIHDDRLPFIKAFIHDETMRRVTAANKSRCKLKIYVDGLRDINVVGGGFMIRAEISCRGSTTCQKCGGFILDKEAHGSS